MNKLLYNETIKHIDNSIIQDCDHYNYSKNDVTLRAENPVSQTVVYFYKNTEPNVSYSVSFCNALDDKPFAADESERLFKYVEKRYNDHFKDATQAKINLYKRMLISNSMSRQK